MASRRNTNPCHSQNDEKGNDVVIGRFKQSDAVDSYQRNSSPCDPAKLLNENFLWMKSSKHMTPLMKGGREITLPNQVKAYEEDFLDQ